MEQGRVEVFSIGFGRELFGWNDRHGTRWKVSAVPLGGYVKMFGQGTPDPGDSPGGAPRLVLSAAKRRVVQSQAAVAARPHCGGRPAANFLFAIVLTAIVFATVGQQLTATVIGEVVQDRAAAAAGLKPGDKVLTANGQQIQRSKISPPSFQLPGRAVELQVQRGGQVIDLEAQPKIIEVTDIFGNVHRIGRLGVGSSGPGEIVHYGPATALWVATVELIAPAPAC